MRKGAQIVGEQVQASMGRNWKRIWDWGVNRLIKEEMEKEDREKDVSEWWGWV